MRNRPLESERILITGSGGVLGTALVAALEAGSFQFLAPLRRADCDLLDAAATLTLWQNFKPSVVFHLAGRVAGVQGNISNAGRAFYENTLINLNVIEASRLTGVRKIIAAGTIAVYSDEASLPMREDDIWKGRPHSSEEAYAHAKRAMLAQLEAYRKQYDLDFAYMLCSNLYGENDRFDEQFGHVIPALISRFERSVRQGDSCIPIWSDGSPTRDFVYSGDAADAFLAAARFGQGCYNVATGTSITIRELVNSLKSVFNYHGEIVWDPSKPSGQRSRSYDASRLRGLGWEPTTLLEAGLERTAAWFRANIDSVRR